MTDSASSSSSYLKTVAVQSTPTLGNITKIGIFAANSDGTTASGNGTANVELRLYEVDSSGAKTGRYIVIDTLSHTFDE